MPPVVSRNAIGTGRSHGPARSGGADTFSFDLVFGSDPGVRATIDLAETSVSVYSESRVLAIVQFPAAALESLKARVGERADFEGTLRKVDGFMKNLYIAHGRLRDGA